MARARNIKPGFYKNEDLAECSVWARLIFPGLWMMADREGRLEDRPKRIKGELLPYDSQDVEPLLKELTAHGFITRYQIDGSSYIQITKFTEHQAPHYSEKASVIKPPQFPETKPPISPNNSGKPPVIKRGSQPPDSLNPDSLNPESGKEHRSPSGSRLTLETLPEDWRSYCKTERPELNPDRVFLDFRDYWIAKPGKDGRKADWQATWRGWVRRQGQFDKPQAKPPESLYERNLRAVGIEPEKAA